MRYLILSDIHANREALESVLDHAAGQYESVLCCGDLVGYGADPNPVVEWVRANCQSVVRGNHDRACTGMEDLEWFNPVAKQAALWTQAELTAENSDYTRNLPQGPITIEDFQLIHGAPYDEDEYVMEPDEAVEAFAYLESRVAFFGHTHVQGGFLWNHSRVETLARTPAHADGLRLDLDECCAYLLNPGSVGQPRDNDPRAAYILFDPAERQVRYRRCAYDIEKSRERIHQAGLPAILGDRLAVGR